MQLIYRFLSNKTGSKNIVLLKWREVICTYMQRFKGNFNTIPGKNALISAGGKRKRISSVMSDVSYNIELNRNWLCEWQFDKKKSVLKKHFWNWSETCVQFDCIKVQITEIPITVE